ncbi:PRKCA-binding protein-like isoform X2 [Daphnia carinata]|uniref:PRKCA-binding protein-like isoform X2 n=1 Tax=Daphnia carinata TaxID=120202 RepID=UPI00257B8CCB|nr:PRKCA-binding protein-like isoform X2 [Daphnia carinata]
MLSDYEPDFFFEEDKIASNWEDDMSIASPASDGIIDSNNRTNDNNDSDNLPDVVNSDELESSSCMLLEVEDIEEEMRGFFWPENHQGMTITTGSVVLEKDGSNLIGISIGGGAPYCPCLYIVQIFDNTPAAKEGTLQSGDEITGVDNISVKGKTKSEVAKMIQAAQSSVTIRYNKLHAEPAQGKTLDLILKKVKHRLVENMSSSTADALGLSRAILCNDSLLKRLEDLKRCEGMYRGLVEHTRRLLRSYYDLSQTYKDFGNIFSTIGVRELQPRASEVFTKFGEIHRQMERYGVQMIKQLKPVLADLGTFLHKAIPDTRMTIGRYADAKFEYLSYCLKVKEMDDEEQSYHSLQEPSYRIETGNYEYRLVLRCRQDARARFAALRSDVQVKIELLDNKHVQDVVQQLQRLLNHLTTFYDQCHQLLDGQRFFPIEVDLSKGAFTYESVSGLLQSQDDEEPEEYNVAEEAKETSNIVNSSGENQPLISMD